ncbi:unnamed protein product [Rhizoctonia solani]|uniref:Ricin B lectin domain-containing protein n=1 Tax=Rhizoctonia solani TaxID=456999 RepID=A0A8H3BSL2_9AGAM|nr:unnamed protein product [Rhizoctonia solani]
MTSIKPGTYRIVNKRDGKAITIPANLPGTIAGCKPPNSPNQKWFVRCSGNYYHFEDCLYGKFIAPDHTKHGTRVSLERYPVDWEILPLGINQYLIKLVGHDLALDLHGDGEVHCWSQDGTIPQRLWRFERLSDFTGDSPKNSSDLTNVLATKDKVIARLTELLEQKERKIQEQRREILQKEREISQLNSCTANPTASGSSGQSEADALREKVDRLELLLNRWMDQGNNRPNNSS